VDPLAGSYFIEALTDENGGGQAVGVHRGRCARLGGVMECIRNGFFPARDRRGVVPLPRQEVESGDRIIVGVNDYQIDEAAPIPTLYVDPAKERIHLERL